MAGLIIPAVLAVQLTKNIQSKEITQAISDDIFINLFSFVSLTKSYSTHMIL